MLRMQLIILFLLLSSVFSGSAQQIPDVKPDSVTARARILQARYCRADADVFTVSLKLKIEIANSSKSAVYMLWPMVPWVAKVASDVREAESGHFLYEQTASHYLQGPPTRFDRVKIGSGKKVMVRSGYDLIARHDPAFSLPHSVAAGTYGLVLVLSPEEEPPIQMKGPGTVESMTTNPFLFEVPIHPKLANCETGTKAK